MQSDVVRMTTFPICLFPFSSYRPMPKSVQNCRAKSTASLSCELRMIIDQAIRNPPTIPILFNLLNIRCVYWGKGTVSYHISHMPHSLLQVILAWKHSLKIHNPLGSQSKTVCHFGLQLAYRPYGRHWNIYIFTFDK